MYQIEIKTKYNVINLTTDDPNSPEMQEILSQPYVLEVKMEKVSENVEDFTEFNGKNVNKVRKLKKGGDKNGKKL